MQTPTFPGTDRPFAPINLGGNPFGWTSSRESSEAVLDAFLAAGGSFVDTADAYSAWAEGHEGGESERILGQWMADRGNRDQVLVATKVGKKPGREGLAHDSVLAALEESLERLQTDYLDLYYAHADDEQVAIEDQVATFDEVARSGRVRAIGLSNYSPDRLRAFMETAAAQGAVLPTAIQPRYSLVSRSAYETDLAPLVAEFGLAVFSYPALASGFLTGKYRGGLRRQRARRRGPEVCRGRRVRGRRRPRDGRRAARRGSRLGGAGLAPRSRCHRPHRLGLTPRAAGAAHGGHPARAGRRGPGRAGRRVLDLLRRAGGPALATARRADYAGDGPRGEQSEGGS